MAINTNSLTWVAVAEYAEQRIKELRELNDNYHDTEDTAGIRAGISEMNKLLNLGEKAGPEKVENTDYID